MKKLLMTACVTAATIIASSAMAANVSGVVQSIDKSRDAIRLRDGMVLRLSEGTEAENFKPGTKVRVTYTKRHGENVASSVERVK
ncbi:DUF1344 domain-containing protein [Ensifer sp. ZNC0028]|uniref:DUF1344 domain-containing protein n=1 Tax=unclassified Ensifer TaxID=2633371 RepID=UPI0005BC4F2F|nr:DUF1344 domain-containing protein [Ensifer sp. ZNC0028]